jgi:hypothetical protein
MLKFDEKGLIAAIIQDADERNSGIRGRHRGATSTLAISLRIVMRMHSWLRWKPLDLYATPVTGAASFAYWIKTQDRTCCATSYCSVS